MHHAYTIISFHILCQLAFVYTKRSDGGGEVNKQHKRNNKHRHENQDIENNSRSVSDRDEISSFQTDEGKSSIEKSITGSDYKESSAVETAKEQPKGSTSRDEYITNMLLKKERMAGKANKIKVPPKIISNTPHWVDPWSGCKCGKGIPGKRKVPKRKKTGVLRIASGYGPSGCE